MTQLCHAMRDERMPQSSTAARIVSQGASGTQGNSGNRHDMVWQPPHKTPKVKLTIFDGKEDWDSFMLPFERETYKYGWTGAEQVDGLHDISAPCQNTSVKTIHSLNNSHNGLK